MLSLHTDSSCNFCVRDLILLRVPYVTMSDLFLSANVFSVVNRIIFTFYLTFQGIWKARISVQK